VNLSGFSAPPYTRRAQFSAPKWSMGLLNLPMIIRVFLQRDLARPDLRKAQVYQSGAPYVGVRRERRRRDHCRGTAQHHHQPQCRAPIGAIFECPIVRHELLTDYRRVAWLCIFAYVCGWCVGDGPGGAVAAGLERAVRAERRPVLDAATPRAW